MVIFIPNNQNENYTYGSDTVTETNASQNFANQVSNHGIVRAILYYPEMREDAIWFTEKEILIKKMVEIIIGSLN